MFSNGFVLFVGLGVLVVIGMLIEGVGVLVVYGFE